MTRLRVLVVAALLLLTSTAAVALASARPAASHARTQAGSVMVTSKGAESTAPDTDNLQVGDQTTPDKPGSPMDTGGGEQNANEEGQAGDSGHQDPAGNVNHQCGGDCVE